ncbi:MAG: BamA/TamA family outer membrane protein [Ferruginibacter sp.]
MITGAKSPRSKTVFNTPFAQYAKADIDLRYKQIYKNNVQWANRFELGIGFPYNNSAMLPFSKQYIIGGANSMRGFPVRSLGPGTYLPTLTDKSYFQVIGGDYKILGNTELRFPIAGKLSGATFIDAGNIWTKDTTLFGPAGKLTRNFYKEIAVSSGFGLRFDINVLLIRLDLGIPLRKPYYPDGQRWVFDKIDFGSRDWRRDNLIVNIAIGLPF